MDSVNNNNNNTLKTALKVAGIGASVGAVARGGREYLRQKKILNHPDEFIRNLEAAAAKAEPFNNEFFKGTEAAAKAAQEQMAQFVNIMTEFAKGGKVNWKGVLSNAGIGALIVGLSSAAVYGLVKLVKPLIKGGAKAAAEGVSEAKSQNE